MVIASVILASRIGSEALLDFAPPDLVKGFFVIPTCLAFSILEIACICLVPPVHLSEFLMGPRPKNKTPEQDHEGEGSIPMMEV